MIGLGSNRLTVCRRGGMSVTQAGRGGMEWLAGGRIPIWAQWWLPYSRQAGEALKDAFTAAQWATIRDYGFAHPEIVGYMNAYAPEDANIAYSLVEGIGWRLFDGGGSAYINFNQQFKNTGFPLDLKAQVKRTAISSTQYIFGNYSVSGSAQQCFEFAVRVNDVIIWCSPDANINSYSTAGLVNLHYRLTADDKRYIGINGTDTEYSGSTSRALANANNYMTLFGCVQESGYCTLPLGRCDLVLGTTELILCPFKRGTVLGMLDIKTNTFYAPTGGTFTELIESPS